MEEKDHAKRWELHTRELIRHLEAKRDDTIKDQVAGEYSNLAVALYQQARLTEARAAALNGKEGWREDFIKRVDQVLAAVSLADTELCECLPQYDLWQKFTIERFEQHYLLHCVDCQKLFACSQLPEDLKKFNKVRSAVVKAQSLDESIPDSTPL